MPVEDFLTVDGVKNWRAVIEKEDSARNAWFPKYGWLIDEYRDLEKKLRDLKSKRIYIVKIDKTPDTRDPGPSPNSTSHEIGWLASKPEFQLEVVGPYPYTKQYYRQMFPSKFEK